MKLSKFIKMLQTVERDHGGDVLVKQKNFAVCQEEDPKVLAVKPGKFVGRRNEDKPYKVLVIESRRYREYMEDPDQ